jgi:hypothetical protein
MQDSRLSEHQPCRHRRSPLQERTTADSFTGRSSKRTDIKHTAKSFPNFDRHLILPESQTKRKRTLICFVISLALGSGVISLPSSSLVTPLFEAPLREWRVTFHSKSRFIFNPSSHRSSKKLGQLGQVPFFVGFL